MKSTRFSETLAASLQHLQTLRERVAELPVPQQLPLADSLTQLTASLEELQMAREAVESQNQEVRETLGLYESVIAQMPMSLAVWRLENPENLKTFRLIVMNPAFERRFGNAFSGGIGNRIDELLPACMEVGCPQMFAETIRGGIPRDLGEIRYADDRIPESFHRLAAFPLPDNCIGVLGENITARKQMEAALHQSEATARALLNAFTETAFLLDPELNFLAINETGAQRLGKGVEELVGTCVLDYLSPTLASHHQAQLHQAIESGRSVCFEDERDGRYFQHSLQPIFDECGKVTKIAVFAQDVTECKRHQAELREGEELFRRMFEEAPIGIGLADPSDYRFVQVNRQFCEMLGYSEGELCGRTCAEITHPDDWEMNRLSMERFQQQELSSYKLEKRFITKDGNVVWVNVTMTGIYDAKGKLRYALGMNEDITDRKRAEEALHRREVLFRTICEASPVGIFLDNPEGKCVYMNRQLEEIYGLPKEDVLSGKYLDFFHPDDRDRLLGHWSKTLKYQTIFEGSFRFQRSDGTMLWLKAKAVPVHDRDLLVGYVGTLEDITDRHHWEVQMHSSLKEKEVLLREIHHRVKNNLQIVSSLLMLQSGALGSLQATAMFEECHNRIAAMAMIHEQLYRSENLVQISLGEYIHTLCDRLLQCYRQDPQPIQLQIQTDEVFLNLDRAIPCGLILNEVVANCLKHAFATRQDGEIAIACHLRDRQIEVEVSDNGIGLPVGFDLQTAQSLGLQLVFHLASQLQGTALLTPRSDGGTLFTLGFEIDS